MSNIGNKEIMARNIAKYMELNHETRRDISEILNVPYTTVTNWVKANTYPRIDKIELLAEHWGVQKSDLVEDKPTTANTPEQLVNGDEELTEYLEMLRTRPECRMFFSLTKGATKADVEKAVAIVEAIRKAEGKE